MWFRVLFLASTAHAFRLLGCYDPIAPQYASANGIAAVQTVQGCVDTCGVLSKGIAGLFGGICTCLTDESSIPRIFKNSTIECSGKCIDSLPCGSFPSNDEAFSLYILNPDEIKVNSTRSRGVTRPTAEAGTTDTVEYANIGAGDRSRIGWIVGISLAIVALFAAIALFIYWRKKRTESQKKTTLPRLETVVSDDIFLIPGLLPKTPNMIYSVLKPYNARYYGELTVMEGDMIIIKKWFRDEWAQGIVVSTSESGLFPLAILINEDRPINPRADSLQEDVICH